MTEHTKGPWANNEQHPWTGYGDVDSVIMAGEQVVATIYGGRELQPRITALLPFAQTRANARLIAAAPDLLTALHVAAHALDCLDPRGGRLTHPTPAEMIDQTLAVVNEAIAKAAPLTPKQGPT